MEVFKGINFEILCEGQPLTLYEDPDKDQKEVNENAKLYYVEAVAGAQFVPKVTLNPSHSLSGLKEDDMVKIKLSPDGANSYQKSLSKRSIERSRQMGQSVTTVFTRHIYREPASERWVEGQLSFSDLAIRMRIFVQLGARNSQIVRGRRRNPPQPGTIQKRCPFRLHTHCHSPC